MKRLALRALVILALAACTRAISEPEDPHWGKQPCAHCAMLVSTRRYAAEGTLDGGERLFFDDVGCLAAWERDHPKRFAHAWAHDDANGWIPLQAARFHSGEATPMDFGFVAVRGGAELTIDDVRTRVLARLSSSALENVR